MITSVVSTRPPNSAMRRAMRVTRSSMLWLPCRVGITGPIWPVVYMHRPRTASAGAMVFLGGAQFAGWFSAIRARAPLRAGRCRRCRRHPSRPPSPRMIGSAAARHSDIWSSVSVMIVLPRSSASSRAGARPVILHHPAGEGPKNSRPPSFSSMIACQVGGQGLVSILVHRHERRSPRKARRPETSVVVAHQFRDAQRRRSPPRG